MGQAVIKQSKTQCTEIFEKYTNHLRNHGMYSTENGAILLQLLFPEEDAQRKFGMQEKKLSSFLVKVLVDMGIGKAHTVTLSNWAGYATELGRGRAGCLGEELRSILQFYPREGLYRPTIREVDALFDELASHERFTQLPDKEKSTEKRSQLAVLKDLYYAATADEASVITQVILKDLHPILSPLKIIHTGTNLLNNKRADTRLTMRQALRIWNPRLRNLYDVHASIQNAFSMLENGTGANLEPELGIPVQIPKCHKGRSCKDAINTLASSKRIWCETKYDGERMQIHVDLSLPAGNQITIFSKSRRDSTLDRFATHDIIRAALGIPLFSDEMPHLTRRALGVKQTMGFSKSIVLEAEMVSFSEKTGLIDEFWRIRDLVAATAKGVRRRPDRPSSHKEKRARSTDSSESDEGSGVSQAGFPSSHTGYSLESDGSDDGDRHFQLIFFELLHVDGRGLLGEPYKTRRRLLQEAITVIEGFAALASRLPIDVVKGDPCRALQSILSSSISRFEEGLVLKAEEATYNSQALPWVKLKRDYIPGVYDCIDMAVIGATWNKERARELEVGTDTFTTFYIAALSQRPEKLRDKASFECLFTVSYGFSREQLERINFEIKDQLPIPYRSKAEGTLSYTYHLCPGLVPPSVILRKPMLFELFGAGFDKPQGAKYYALRWPRVSKVYRTQERHWTTGETLESFSAKAYAAVGRDPSAKSSTIQVARMWDISPEVSPIARSVVKTKAIEFDCLSRLRRNEPHRSAEEGSPSSHRGKRTRNGGIKLVAFSVVEEEISLNTNDMVPGRFPDPLDLLQVSTAADAAHYSDSDDSPRKRRNQRGTRTCAESPSADAPNSKDANVSHWEMTTTPQADSMVSSKCVVLPPETSLMASSSPLPAASPLRTPPSCPLQDHTTTEKVKPASTITMQLLLSDSFILVYRPIYPPPIRPKHRPALRIMLPGHKLVSTLEALLVGVSWTPRRAPFSKIIKRGVIFVEPADVGQVITELEGRSRMIRVGHELLAKIFVVSKSYLDIYCDLDKSAAVDVLWESD